MKFVWAFLGFIVIIAAVSGFPADQQSKKDVDSLVTNDEWREYKDYFDKKYPNEEEDNRRRHIYAQNKQKVTENNKKIENGAAGYKRDIHNEYSDRTDEEMQAVISRLRPVTKPRQ